MSKFLLFLCFVSAHLLMNARTYAKFDTGSRLEFLRSGLADGSEKAAVGRSINEEAATMVIVTLNDGYAPSDLTDSGLELVSSLGNDMCIVRGPFELILGLEDNDAVRSLSLGERLTPNLDGARAFSSVDLVHTGTDLPGLYTGNGVVCGIYDTGVDPNHINFYNPDFNESRVKAVYNYVGSYGSVKQLTTPDEIARFTTDNTSSTHGTHTLGIMAGSFNNRQGALFSGPKGSYAVADERTNKVTIETDGRNPYYGIAPDADIVVACGETYESSVLAGLSKITEYARLHKQPVVINLSMGQIIGPHDGSDAFSKGLERIGQDALVCISSGNEGNCAVSVVKRLTEEDRALKTFFNNDMYIEGTVDLWSSDRNALELAIVIVDTSTGKTLYSFPVPLNETVSLATFNYTPSSIVSDVFQRYFHSSFISIATSDNSSTNQRYNARMHFYLERKDMNNPNIAVGIIAEGQPGARIDLVGKNNLGQTSFRSYGLEGWSDSNSELSVNSTACAANVIAVGAYSTRSVWADLDQNLHQNSIRLFSGRIAGFSGYGETYDGRRLPHVVAPGVTVVSSLNSYLKNPGAALVSDFLYNGRHYYWGANSGTSMATPVVSGIIATWLQYNPDLTVAEVIDIISKTSVVDEDCLNENPVKIGAGKINAYEGLKEVIRRSSVSDIKSEAETIFRWIGENMLEVFVPRGNIDVDIYNVSGHHIRRVTGASDTLVCDFNDLSAGLYILKINNTDTHRIIIK